MGRGGGTTSAKTLGSASRKLSHGGGIEKLKHGQQSGRSQDEIRVVVRGQSMWDPRVRVGLEFYLKQEATGEFLQRSNIL